jgi:queuine tRNA-ribosyltransferase
MKNNSFTLIKKDEKTSARLGKLELNHGVVTTPIFMPVGTRASVKTVSSKELLEHNAEIILANTYHLFLRPGNELVKKAGGLNKFMNFPKPILTDSGGFQVFSLSSNNKIKDDGVEFRSHIDGKRFFLSPEKAINIQQDLFSDIMMNFDECSKYGVTYEYAIKALERTTAWAKRCKDEYLKKDNGQKLFGIVQGNFFKSLRDRSLEEIVNIGFDGYAIGGLSVGEPKDVMYEMLEYLKDKLPENRPRYLMGVGTPEDIFFAVENGVDMFDCVHPTRIARHGTLFTKDGRINIKNKIFEDDFSPIEEDCDCFACKNHTKAYIRHLYRVGEPLALRLCSLHNINFLINLTKKIKIELETGNFSNFKLKYMNRYHGGKIEKN